VKAWPPDDPHKPIKLSGAMRAWHDNLEAWSTPGATTMSNGLASV
jgi:hypothetical protein